jgi:hypothetical protein
MTIYSKYLTTIICLVLLSGMNVLNAQQTEEPAVCNKDYFPLAGSLKVLTYRSPTDNMFYGYISGNSINGDKIKANLFKFNNQFPYISGAYFDFGVATNSTNPDITFAVWDQTINGYPDNIITTSTRKLSDIQKDVISNRETFVSFDSKTILKGNYFIGVILPVKPGDTLALRSNSDNDTNPGNAWEQWLDGKWHAYYEHGCWDINISNAIYPYVCDKTEGIINPPSQKRKSLKIYPNPAKDNINIELW